MPNKKHTTIWLILFCIFLSIHGQSFAAYVDNGDGTVTDTETGLTWLAQSLGPMSLAQAFDVCVTGTWAGRDDWRLPDRNELQSIVDYGVYNPAVDSGAFPGTQSAAYWTSSIHTSDPFQAWYVRFSDGVVSYAGTTSSYYVRPVRGGGKTMISEGQCAALTPYVDNGDGTVYDKETGLTWLQSSLGAMSLDQAFDASETGTWAGFDDWRLPDRNELQSLVFYKRYSPAVDPQKFADTVSDAYWTSSIHFPDPSQAWYVRFADGVVSYAAATTAYQVRPVRGGPKSKMSLDQCQALTPYYDAGDAAVADAGTGLMWLKTTLGPMSWEQALSTCENGTWGGHDDWRLPDRNELQSLVFYKRHDPAVDPQKFADTDSSAYWTATTNTPDPSQAWYVRFSDGLVSYAGKGSGYYVRPVRDNPGSIVVDYVGDRGWALEAESFTLKFVSDVPVVAYYWDMNNDGQIDHITFDSEMTHFFVTTGEHLIRVKAYTASGDEILALVTVRVGEPGVIDGDIRFEPFSPDSDDVASTVMKGGKAVRYYRVMNAASGLPLPGRRICYTLSLSTPVICTNTDDQGFLEMETPAVESSQGYFFEAVDETGSPKGIQITDRPAFFVYAEERRFTESYGLFVGTSASVGKGLGAKVGPVEFKALEAGIGAGTHVVTDFGYDNQGDDADFFIGNILGSDLEGKLKAGLFGKTAINSPTRPKLEVGASLTLNTGTEFSTGYAYPGFVVNKNVSDAQQALAAGIILLESTINAAPQTIPGMDTLLKGLISKAMELYGMDMETSATGSSFSFGGSGSLGASLGLKNPLGLEGTAGSTWEFGLSGFDGEFVYTFESDFKNDGTVLFGQSIAGSLDVGGFSMSLGQKFAGDKRRNNTPKCTLGSILSTSPWLQKDGEQGARIRKYFDGSTELEYYRLLERDQDSFLLLGADITEKYIHYIVSDPGVIQWLTKEPGLAREMNDLGEGDRGMSIFPVAYSKFYTALFDNDAGPVDWEEITRDQRLFDMDLDFELALGLSLGAGIALKAWKQVEYVSARGKLDKGAMVKTAVYEKDSHIRDHIKGKDPFIQAGRQAVREVCGPLIDTIEGIIEAGKDVIVVVQETGAKIKSAAGNLYEGSKVFLSKINPLQKSYAIMALTGLSSKGLEETNADTVGQVYIVNVQDETGVPLTVFPSLLELTLTYTEADITAAGYTLADAGRLRIYRWDGNSGFYILIGGTVNESEYSVTALINRPGQYLLAIDGTPPEVGFFEVSSGTRAPEISFILLDSLSGIDVSTIEMYIDGELLVSGSGWADVYDMTSGRFVYQVTQDLDLGEHTLEIIAADLLGNTLRHTEMFVINDLAPVITHTPVTSAEIGVPLIITASVTDDQAVAGVQLSCRPKTDETAYVLATMILNDATGFYEAGIPARYLTGHGIRYFIRAVDISDNVSETDPGDIVITDLQGPAIPGGLTVTFSEDQFRVSWPPAQDIDTAGYHLYLGETPEQMLDMGNLGLTGFELLDLSWDEYFVGIQAVDDFNNFGPMAGPILTGRKADLDRDRDVDGKDIHGLILKLETGETDLTVDDTAAVFGETF